LISILVRLQHRAVLQVGLWVREILSSSDYSPSPRLPAQRPSGLRSLNTAVTYEQTKPFAKSIAQLLEQRHPDLVVSDMKKAVRVNKVFVD